MRRSGVQFLSPAPINKLRRFPSVLSGWASVWTGISAEVDQDMEAVGAVNRAKG